MKKKQVETAKTKEPKKSVPSSAKKKKQRTAKEDSALVLAILAIAFAVLAVLSALFLPTALQLATLLLGCIWFPDVRKNRHRTFRTFYPHWICLHSSIRHRNPSFSRINNIPHKTKAPVSILSN